MIEVPLTPVLTAAGLQLVGGITIAVMASLLERPSFQRQSRWTQMAALWGAVFALAGAGQLLFWIWSADLDGEGPPLSITGRVVLLLVTVALPIAFGMWRTWQIRQSVVKQQSRPAV